ncbi:hypothetical protein ATANTOWER_030713 [Ataeniobius toweri]|uniref:Uncharacterized protein n=1 Tax=Ataeniobius toweri TaxID=208326 RepID=A0ABU7B088_9TELE|nr:hypothetical protein [Ataeniobius toweri]
MKKITEFKQKEDQTDGCQDRANELNTFCNRFSSVTSSASFSPALITALLSYTLSHSQTDITPSFDPQLFCHTSNVLSSTSAMGHSASSCLPSTKSEDADAPSTCVSQEVR